MKTIIITLGIAVLMPIASHANNEFQFCDEELGYCFYTSNQFKDSQWSASPGLSGRKADHFGSNLLPSSDPMKASIEIYENPQYPCQASSLGNNPNPTIVEKIGSYTIWSKMPLVNAHTKFMDVYCTEMRIGCTREEVFEGTCITESATYAFCSEGDDKRVAICINQQKDNPDMARKVFESFRWLDEETEPKVETTVSESPSTNVTIYLTILATVTLLALIVRRFVRA